MLMIAISFFALTLEKIKKINEPKWTQKTKDFALLTNIKRS